MTFSLAGRRGALRLALVGAVLSSGCTFAMYPGPKRPATETARIEANGPSSIRNIDGMDLPVGSVFTVLPGLHAVTVGAPAANPAAACFKAEAGHWYALSLEELGRRFAVSITDVGPVSLVRSVDVAPGTASCAAVAAALDPRPRAVTRAAVIAASTPPSASDAAEEDEADAGSETPAEIAPADEAGPAVAAQAAVDPETPRAQRRPAEPSVRRVPPPPADDDEEDPMWARHPGNGVVFELGAFFGGTDLVKTTDENGNTVATLTGGGGVVVGFGGMWTPLWAGDAAGFGLGGVVSLKYQTVSAGGSSVSLLRFPVSLAAHTFLHVDGHWWFLLRAGVQKELGVSLSADGSGGTGDASLTGSAGVLGEAGVYFVTHVREQRAALLLAFRYTSGTDSNAGGSFSASSGGLVLGLHHNF